MGETYYWILLVLLLPVLLLGSMAPLQEQMELERRQRDLELLSDTGVLEKGQEPWDDRVFVVRYFEEYWVYSTGESPGIPRYYVELLDGEPVYFSRRENGAWVYREGARVLLGEVDPELRKKALGRLRMVTGREGSWDRGILLAVPRRDSGELALLEKRL